MRPCEDPTCPEAGTIQLVYLNENIGPHWWCPKHVREYVIETFPSGVSKAQVLASRGPCEGCKCDPCQLGFRGCENAVHVATNLHSPITSNVVERNKP